MPSPYRPPVPQAAPQPVASGPMAMGPRATQTGQVVRGGASGRVNWEYVLEDLAVALADHPEAAARLKLTRSDNPIAFN